MPVSLIPLRTTSLCGLAYDKVGHCLEHFPFDAVSALMKTHEVCMTQNQKSLALNHVGI